MAGTEELFARLQQLEDGYYGDKEAARQQKFFDMYGDRFSNDHSLGMAILNELDARGVDTSAADEAVDAIISQLRTECNMLSSLLKDVQQKAEENAEKINTIKEVFDEKVASNPDSSVNPGDLDIGSEEFNPDEMGGMPPEGGEPAPAPEMGGMPPEGGEPAPAPDMGTPMPEEPPPQNIVSDERVKNIRMAYSRVRARKASKAGFKPSAGILSACRGGE